MSAFDWIWEDSREKEHIDNFASPQYVHGIEDELCKSFVKTEIDKIPTRTHFGLVVLEADQAKLQFAHAYRKRHTDEKCNTDEIANSI